jgi:CHAT domain-containing protein
MIITNKIDCKLARIKKVILAFVIATGVWVTTYALAQEEAAIPASTATTPISVQDPKQSAESRTATELLLRAELKAAEEKYGTNSEQVLVALQKLAQHLESNLPQRKELIVVLERALPLVKTLRGPKHVETGRIMASYGVALERDHLNLKAEPILSEALHLLKPVESGDIEKIIKVMDSLVGTLSRAGYNEMALKLAQENLEFVDTINTFRPDDNIYASILVGRLADVYQMKGDYAKALPLYHDVLDRYKKLHGEEHSAIASVLNNLGLLYKNTGLYNDALRLYQRALEINTIVSGSEHPNTARSLNALAALYGTMGEYDKALSLAKHSVEIYERVPGPTHPDLIESRNTLALIYEDMGKFDQAFPLVERNLKLAEKIFGESYPETAVSLNNLAAFYVDFGQYDLALPLFKRSLAIFMESSGSDHPSVATAMNNIAEVYEAHKTYDQALPLLKRSLEIREKRLGPQHPDTASSLNNLASLYIKTAQYEKALSLYKTSLEISENVLGQDHPDTIRTLSNLGFLYISMGKLIDAEATLHEAVMRAQRQEGARNTLWNTLHGLTLVHKKMHHPNLAILWGKEAVNTLQSLRGEVKNLAKELQSSFLTNKRPVYQDLADLLIAEGRLVEAQDVLQMLKEQELHDSLQRSEQKDPRTTRIALTGLESQRFARYYALQDQQIELGKEREQLQRKQKLGDIKPDELKRLNEINNQKLPPLRAAMLTFLKALQTESDKYTQGKDKDYRKNEIQIARATTNLQNVLTSVRNTDPNAKVAALQYVVTDSRLSILLSTPGAPPLARQIEFDGKALRNRILTVREQLSNSRSDPDILKKQLAALYTQLIAPIANDIKATGATTLILVPNDVLRYVPFAALYDGERYLVQDYTLTLFNEAVKKDKQYFSKQADVSWRLAAMGLTRATENLPALTSVSKELNAIIRLTGRQGALYLDDNFTRVVLQRTLAEDFNVLHLASHFVFIAGRPEASRLILGDLSSLYLGDIARDQLRFDHFALVTFSACESGLGGGLDADGAEMESLGALVQNQGAQAVMATLWKVEDSSTAELMKTFYQARHDNNLGKAAALRNAQLELISRKTHWWESKVVSHPYYWAPFVLMGDWR